MKPLGGLVIAMGAKPKASEAGPEAAGEATDSKPSASSALFDSKAAALAKMLGLDAAKHAKFAKALRGVIAACDYDEE